MIFFYSDVYVTSYDCFCLSTFSVYSIDIKVTFLCSSHSSNIDLDILKNTSNNYTQSIFISDSISMSMYFFFFSKKKREKKRISFKRSNMLDI